jgi:hypothetical protein
VWTIVPPAAADWWGIDRYLLPRLGTPWAPGHAAEARQQMPEPT